MGVLNIPAQSRIIFGLIFISILVMGSVPISQAQESGCSEPRVSVLPPDITDTALEYLNSDSNNVPRTLPEWQQYIANLVMQELRKNSPGTVFIPGECPDCDYRFDPTLDVRAHGMYTAYSMFSSFAAKPVCRAAGHKWTHHTGDDRNLEYTIRRNIAAHGDIGETIDEYEDAGSPARGPRMKVSPDREFVSPVKDERELKLQIDVTNCKGTKMYHIQRNRRQQVRLPKTTDRGEFNPTKDFLQQDSEVIGNTLILLLAHPVGGNATYTLNSGTDADREHITITACGRDRDETKEEEIVIYGLDLEVTPDRMRISTEDRADIWIKLSKIDPDGKKMPVPGKTIQLDIRGLVDGNVKPTGKYITDDDGEVYLVYTSGENDKSVTFDAKFQPVDYPEFVSDKATIAVTKPYWQGTLHYWEKESYACSFKATEATKWRYHEENTNTSEIGTINFRYEDPYLNVKETATTTGSSDYKRHFFRDAGVKAECTILIDKHWDDHTCREQIEPEDLNIGIPSDLPRNPGTYPIKVSVTLRRTCKSKWKIDRYTETRWPCENDHPPDVRDPPPETYSSTYRLGFRETLKGTLTVKRDGTRQISASMNHAYDVPGDNYTDIGGPQCPPYKRSISVSIQMTGGS
jgi:hypothetical protein